MVWLGSRTFRVQEVIPVKRKTPYSLVDVNRISVESIISVRKGQSVIVGVDVAKKEVIGCLYWPDRSFDRPVAGRVAGADSAVYRVAQEVVNKLSAGGGDGIIRVKKTGEENGT